MEPENSTANATGVPNAPHWIGHVQIALYAVIFFLAVIGNSLVILTLVKNQRMRTITNVFLLNLAVSDLLLGVLCMPFTLVGALLRNFVFGEVMCKLLPYLQASSVSVSAWTLVVISVERYYAICHPLSSRRWQTLSHAYKLIVCIWIGSLVSMLPIAFLSHLIPTSKGHHKCREVWPDLQYERIFNLFLDLLLLVVPLLMLFTTYSNISYTLWQAIEAEKTSKATTDHASVKVRTEADGYSPKSRRIIRMCSTRGQPNPHAGQQDSRRITDSYREARLRRTSCVKALKDKKRVIKMLAAVVLEFFVCWTPLYMVNTLALFRPDAVYETLGYTAISFFQLLAYSSSCCNPITYCFMNQAFKKAFLNLFVCFRPKQREHPFNSYQATYRSTSSRHKSNCRDQT